MIWPIMMTTLNLDIIQWDTHLLKQRNITISIGLVMEMEEVIKMFNLESKSSIPGGTWITIVI